MKSDACQLHSNTLSQGPPPLPPAPPKVRCLHNLIRRDHQGLEAQRWKVCLMCWLGSGSALSTGVVGIRSYMCFQQEEFKLSDRGKK